MLIVRNGEIVASCACCAFVGLIPVLSLASYHTHSCREITASQSNCFKWNIFPSHIKRRILYEWISPSPPSCLSVSHKHSNIQSMAIFRLPPPPAKSFEQRFLLSNLSTYQKVDAIARLKCEQNDTRWRGFVTDCHYLLLRCDALLHDNCSLCVCTRAMFQMIADFKCNFLCRALFECLSIHLH